MCVQCREQYAPLPWILRMSVKPIDCLLPITTHSSLCFGHCKETWVQNRVLTTTWRATLCLPSLMRLPSLLLLLLLL
jgi:hypothetical protein